MLEKISLILEKNSLKKIVAKKKLTGKKICWKKLLSEIVQIMYLNLSWTDRSQKCFVSDKSILIIINMQQNFLMSHSNSDIILTMSRKMYSQGFAKLGKANLK